MIFLIEYNRVEGRIVTLKRFKDFERLQAQKSRLDIELDLNRKGVDHEVVLLEAASEEAVRRTHRRYFEDAREILKSATGGQK
jgi:predicted dinucleotide-utilizing enzyme